jgi:predicted transcriptional regulator
MNEKLNSLKSDERLRARIAVIVALFGLFIAVGGLFYNIATTTVKAEQAHEFVEKNRDLPVKVCQLEEDMKEVKKAVGNLRVMQNEQRHLINDLKEVKDALKKIVEDNGRRIP